MPTNESGQPQVVAPGNAQQAKAESVVRQLDVLLLGAAKKSVAADIVNNVNTVGETLVISEYFRTSCPSYYKRDYYDKMF